MTVGGDLVWWDSASGNFLLVTGDPTARNVLLSGCPDVVVRGELTASGAVQGSYGGGGGGYLIVSGRTEAGAVISTLYFSMYFAGQPEALFIAAPSRTNQPVDFTDEELEDLVLPELLGQYDTADEHSISAALREGRPVLRPGIRPSHLVAPDELDALLPRAEEITELDLSDRKLRRLPEQLYAFPNLRVLSLAGDDAIGTLGERIGELPALEERNLAKTGRSAPRRPAGLPGPRRRRPAGHAARTGPVRSPAGRVQLPGRLPSARDPAARPAIPQPLPHTCAVPCPPCSRACPTWRHFPGLRMLRLNGSTPWSFQPEPRRVPGLRRLSPAFNDLTTLPESFFRLRLRHLEAVDLRYTVLDAPTTERLRAVFPHVRPDLRDPESQ